MKFAKIRATLIRQFSVGTHRAWTLRDSGNPSYDDEKLTYTFVETSNKRAIMTVNLLYLTTMTYELIWAPILAL